MTIDEAERKQDKLAAMIGILNKYSTKKIEYIEAKNKVLISVKHFTRGEKTWLKGFKNGIFPINRDKEEEERARYEEEEKTISEMKMVLLIAKGLRH